MPVFSSSLLLSPPAPRLAQFNRPWTRGPGFHSWALLSPQRSSRVFLIFCIFFKSLTCLFSVRMTLITHVCVHAYTQVTCTCAHTCIYICIHAHTQTHVHILHMHTLLHTHTCPHMCIHGCAHIHSPHLSLSFPQRWPQTCMLSMCILLGISPVHPVLSTHGWAFPAYSAGTQTRLYLLDEWISGFFREMGQHWAWLHFCMEAVV